MARTVQDKKRRRRIRDIIIEGDEENQQEQYLRRLKILVPYIFPDTGRDARVPRMFKNCPDEKVRITDRRAQQFERLAIALGILPRGMGKLLIKDNIQEEKQTSSKILKSTQQAQTDFSLTLLIESYFLYIKKQIKEEDFQTNTQINKILKVRRRERKRERKKEYKREEKEENEESERSEEEEIRELQERMTEEISERERSDGEEEEDKYERIPFSRIKKNAFKFSKWGEIENINEIIRLEKQDLTKNEKK